MIFIFFSSIKLFCERLIFWIFPHKATLSLTKKRAIPEKQRQKEYAIRIKESDTNAKLIKLCDISANLGDLKKQPISKTKKRKILKKFRYYLSIIEKDLTNKTEYPKAITLLETINENLKIQTQNVFKFKKKSKWS